MSLFEYKIKGVTLDVNDLREIKEYFDAACVAEYVFDNYQISSEKKALEIGFRVRDMVDRDCISEEEAIYLALKKYEPRLLVEERGVKR